MNAIERYSQAHRKFLTLMAIMHVICTKWLSVVCIFRHYKQKAAVNSIIFEHVKREMVTQLQNHHSFSAQNAEDIPLHFILNRFVIRKFCSNYMSFIDTDPARSPTHLLRKAGRENQKISRVDFHFVAFKKEISTQIEGFQIRTFGHFLRFISFIALPQEVLVFCFYVP